MRMKMTKEEQTSRRKKWQDLIEEQEASGQTQNEFCKERNISLAQLSYYRGIFKPKQIQTGTFAPVAIKQTPSTKDICITLPNGFECIFPSDLNALQMKEWIMVMLSC